MSEIHKGEIINIEDHCKPKSSNTLLKRCTFAKTFGVVIVGHHGAGKRTLVNHWLLSEATDGEQLTMKSQETSKTIVHWYEEDAVVVYDVHILQRESLVDSGNHSKTTFASEYKTRLPRNISLCVFVYRQGRFTNEDKVIFESFLASMHTDNAKRISYLVITNCDGMTEKAKQDTIVEFKENPNTRDIAKHMKEIVCVGLPDLSKVKMEIHDQLKMIVKESETELSSLFESKSLEASSLTIDELLKTPEHEPHHSLTNKYCPVL